MFAYMVAPFALLMLLALGGNGVAAAAEYFSYFFVRCGRLRQ